MLDLFIQIPGPSFLWIFTLYSAIISLIVYYLKKYDYTSNLRIPEPTSLKPIEIAYLRKGIRGALMFSIFGLEKKKALEITPFFKTKLTLIKPLEIDESKLTEQEQIIYNYIGDGKYYRHLYSRGILKSLDRTLQPMLKKLQQLQLAVDDKLIAHHWKTLIIGLILIELFGGIKLYFGITREKPIAFLLLFMVLFAYLFVRTFHPNKVETSTLGKKFLKTAQKRFEWLKLSQNKSELQSDQNLWYTIAAFGITKELSEDMGETMEVPYEIEARSSKSYLASNRESSYDKGCAGCSGGANRAKSKGWGGWSTGGCTGCGSGCSGGCGSGCGGGCGGCGGS